MYFWYGGDWTGRAHLHDSCVNTHMVVSPVDVGMDHGPARLAWGPGIPMASPTHKFGKCAQNYCYALIPHCYFLPNGIEHNKIQ